VPARVGEIEPLRLKRRSRTSECRQLWGMMGRRGRDHARGHQDAASPLDTSTIVR